MTSWKGNVYSGKILCIDTPVQMILCTDTNGKITSIRFHFRDNIDKVISTDQGRGSLGVNFICTVIPHFVYFQIHYTSVIFNMAPALNRMTFIAPDSLIPGPFMLSWSCNI